MRIEEGQKVGIWGKKSRQEGRQPQAGGILGRILDKLGKRYIPDRPRCSLALELPAREVDRTTDRTFAIRGGAGRRLKARKLKTYQASLGFFHVEGSELLRESAIEPHEADRLFQFPESLVDVRAGQNSLQFAVVDQNSGSLRGWRAEVAPKGDAEMSVAPGT